MSSYMEAPETWRKPENLEEGPDIFREVLDEREQKMFMKCSQEDFANYKEIFDIFDLDSDGKIQSSEVMTVMQQALQEKVTETQVNDMISQVDANNDGQVDFEEFICLMVKKLVHQDTMEEELVVVFRRFDKNGDGQIDCKDLMQMMAELGTPIEEDDAEAMIFHLDQDEDQNINFMEFIQCLMYDT